MISLPMGNSNSNLQVAIGRLRERVCRRDEAEGGEARRRRRPRAFSCVEGARWNWVNTGWKRARPTCKASRELGTPGRYTGRSNSIEWRAPFPSQKHFLFVLSRISTSASFFLPFPFLSFPFLSYPILSYPILSYSVLRSFERHGNRSDSRSKSRPSLSPTRHPLLCRFTLSSDKADARAPVSRSTHFRVVLVYCTYRA